MNEEQMKISKENSDNQESGSQIEQNEQETFFERVCQNFRYFVDQINNLQSEEQISHKKKIKKNTKRKTSVKAKKKAKTKSVQQETVQDVIYDQNQQKPKSFIDELQNLIQSGTPLEDLQYLIALLQKKEYQKSFEEIKKRFPTLLQAFLLEFKNNPNFQHNPQSFQNYLQQSSLHQGRIPPNCTHVYICYHIWQNQNKSHIDPTQKSKEIKNEQLENKLQEGCPK